MGITTSLPAGSMLIVRITVSGPAPGILSSNLAYRSHSARQNKPSVQTVVWNVPDQIPPLGGGRRAGGTQPTLDRSPSLHSPFSSRALPRSTSGLQPLAEDIFTTGFPEPDAISGATTSAGSHHPTADDSARFGLVDTRRRA